MRKLPFGALACAMQHSPHSLQVAFLQERWRSIGRPLWKIGRFSAETPPSSREESIFRREGCQNGNGISNQTQRCLAKQHSRSFLRKASKSYLVPFGHCLDSVPGSLLTKLLSWPPRKHVVGTWFCKICTCNLAYCMMREHLGQKKRFNVCTVYVHCKRYKRPEPYC